MYCVHCYRYRLQHCNSNMTIILVYVDDSDVAIMQTHFTKKIENY